MGAGAGAERPGWVGTEVMVVGGGGGVSGKLTFTGVGERQIGEVLC